MSHPYIKGTKVWLADATSGWQAGEILSTTQSSSTTSPDAEIVISVKSDRDDSEPQDLTFPLSALLAAGQDAAGSPTSTSFQDKDGKMVMLPPLRNPPELDKAEDLANLSNLNEPSVLHTISQRYAGLMPYTYSGIVLVALNPFAPLNIYEPSFVQMYAGRKKGEREPHLFAIAEEALDNMRKGKGGGGKDANGHGDQTIVVSGESGAGKTVSAKYILRYFASVEDPNRSSKGPTRRQRIRDETGMTETEQQILASNPIMEAFGNAKTTRNDNSSRFGKYIEILFDESHDIVGARVRTYLLERSRLVYQPEFERNYHIFYQLLAGAPAKERKDLSLGSDPTKFSYMLGGGPTAITINGVNDAEEFRLTQKSLSTVGISVETQWSIFRLLAALLHLGNVKVLASRSDANIAEDDEALALATTLLGIDKAEFKKWTIKKQLITRSEKIVTSLNAVQAQVVRDSVAKFVYSCLFDWLVAAVNESLGGEGGKGADRAVKFIGVLDIYGFEHFKKNSFEQFCINWANEKLQQEFNAHVFKLEQEEYVREEIQWTFIDFSDNQQCIDVIEGKMGILTLLDEESRLVAGADNSFVSKLFQQITKPEQKAVFKKPRFNQNAFTISHYAHDVTYDVEGFIEKNRDTVPDEHLALLQGSSNEFLRFCLEAALTAANAAKELATAPSRTPAVKRAPGATGKKPTLGSIFKNSLSSLMVTINNTNVHYIRCIKPNEAKRAWEFEPQQVLSQLRACGVLETIKISCAGYPGRWTYDEFYTRFEILLKQPEWDYKSAPKDLCTRILQATIPDQDKYQLGLTKIFFRAGMLALLESLRTQRSDYLATLVQKNVRRAIAVKHYQRLRTSTIVLQSIWRGRTARILASNMRREQAAIRIQTRVRGYMERKRYLTLRDSVIKVQALIRGFQARAAVREAKTLNAALLLQSLLRGVAARIRHRADMKGVVYIQSLQRRRLAKKELAGLKIEAKSASKFKEISYQLENKVVQLTQTLQTRTAERKQLQEKVTTLEAQVASWTSKHEDLDTRARDMSAQLAKPSVPQSKFDELLAAKQDADAKLSQAVKRVGDQDAEIRKLTDELALQAQELEEKQLAVEGAVAKSIEDSGTVTGLRNELNVLREQINRANALQALTRNSRADGPTSPQATYTNGGLRSFENGFDSNGTSPPRRRARRHSATGRGGFEADHQRGSSDERMVLSKKDAIAPRAISMAFPQENGHSRDSQGMPIAYEDPEDEIMALLENEQALDTDVLGGLIRDLKIISPSLKEAPQINEVMFPAHLISLITNEMWKFGLIKESERFLANVMQSIQEKVMSYEGEEAIIPGIYWLSNVHEILSFVSLAESDMMQGIGPGAEGLGKQFSWETYERLVTIVKHDLDSLEYNIYHTFMQEIKRKLGKMVIPALVESQALPGFITAEGTSGRLGRMLGMQSSTATPAFGMDDILNILNKVWKALKSYYVEEMVLQQVINELLKLIGVTSFNDMLMRRNFCSWKRAMQIQYNITRIEEWCKSHEMQEGTLQLESLMQATKLLQLKKATQADIDILFDVCWILSPTQIQKLISQYHVADYETPISSEIQKMVSARVNANDKGDHLLLPPETEEAGPYQLPPAREITSLETYVPSYLVVPHVRRLAMFAA